MKKRAWVKWVAAGFLALMLLMTFLSNTIQNSALPEVRLQRVTSGTIGPVVSGSGLVTAAEAQEVTALLPGKVLSTEIDSGAVVTAGQTVLTVEYTDDGTIAQQEETVAQLASDYQQALLSASATANSADAVELQQLKNHLAEAQDNYSRAQRYTAEATALSAKQASAQKAHDAAQAAFDTATAQPRQKLSEAQSALSDAVAAVENAETNESYYRALYESEKTGENESAWNAAKQTLQTAQAQQLHCQNQVYAAQSALSAAEREVQPELDRTAAELSSLSEALTALEETYAGATDENACADQVLSAEASLASWYDQQQANSVSQQLDRLRLEEQKEKLEKARAELAEAKQAVGRTTVTAPDGGRAVLQAETEFTAGQLLFSVEPADRYSMTMSVPMEQAQQLSVGMEARVMNEDMGETSAVLTSIVADETDPTNYKQLCFSVAGENVTGGQYLTLRIALQVSTHAMVVPNQALYCDSLGDFVYVVDSDTSVIGSRHTVRRVDVTIQRSDASNSAVEGNLTLQDYVVVLSSAPIADGDRVRPGGMQ